MTSFLSTFDMIIFFGSLVAIMGVGLWAGRKEETSEDFYLAGGDTRWWGVAGSIFGSNVSANHMMGMMGAGFASGFATSHFEFSAIAGLLLLCYAFLPMYRKLKVYTLSEYLSRRYNDASRFAYAIIMIIIMVIIQMVPGFYIGSRSVNTLINYSGVRATAAATVSEDGSISAIEVSLAGEGYADTPTVTIKSSVGEGATAQAVMEDGAITAINMNDGGQGYKADQPPLVQITGGAGFDPAFNPGDVDPKWYKIGIILMAVITGTYVVFGGLKAVIITDVIQSVLVLLGGLLVAYITFSQPEVDGWANMVAMDAEGKQKLHLYNAMNEGLPWTGMFTGLMVLHFYYWGTNQFIVQRALAAKSDREARIGIIVAGSFKLLIPFFSIATGIAAWYLFEKKAMVVAQDVVFIKLLTELIAPIGFGLVGLVAAAVIGAILSSVDSMMNSAATIVTFDIYKRYVDPEASDEKLIRVGRIAIAAFLVGAAFFTIFTMDPNSEDNFFLHVAKHQGNLVTGVVVAFLMGMIWKRATAAGAIASIVGGIILCYTSPWVYDNYLGTIPAVADLFGAKTHFFHHAAIAAVGCVILHVGVSLNTQTTEEQSALTWTGQGLFKPEILSLVLKLLLAALTVYPIIGALMVMQIIPNAVAGLLGGLVTFAAFLITTLKSRNLAGETDSLLKDDRLWGGLLGGAATFLLYYFY